MPRGSKPGERRGGRQKGTPNKSTALKNAAFLAAARDPNMSPLDFMLGLMRDPKLRLDLRLDMAQAAAPFVHTRPSGAGRDEPEVITTETGLTIRRVNANQVQKSSTRKMDAELSGPSTGGGGGGGSGIESGNGADLSPLNFLLNVMKDSDAAVRLRIKAARVAAPYRHPAGVTARSQLVVEDPYGFDFDPAEVTAHRDDEVEYSLSNSRGQHRDPRKGKQIQARMAAREKTFICPPGYTERENRKDQRRLEELTRKRSRKPSSS